jgi:hypothetical protein
MSLMEPSRSSSNIFYACRGHVETVRACGCYKNRLVEIFVEEEEENPSEDMGYLAAQKPRAEPGWARE